MSVLGHLSLGVSDLARARAFYDAVLGPLGQVCVWASDTGIAYGLPGQGDKLAFFPQLVTDRPLAAGPGFHLALDAGDRATVDAAHAAAVARGGHCEGPPGPRPNYSPTYYAAFFRDPDGHKFEIVHQ